MKVEIKRILFGKSPRYRSLTWLCGWGPLILSHQPDKFGVHRPCESKDIKWQRGWCVMWLCRWDLLILSHYSAKFGVCRPSESGDMFVVCHVTTRSKCHVTLQVRSDHTKSLPCLVWSQHALWKSRYNAFYLSGDRDIEVSRDFVGEVPSSWVTILLRLGFIGLMELEIMAFVISVPIPITIPKFQCPDFQMADCVRSF